MAQRIRGRKLQQLRARLFAHQPLCVECERQGRVRLATQRDHIVALVNGGADSHDNVQPLCAECHAMKSALEARGARLSPEAERRRLPPDLQRSRIPLTIVCGPPGSGKSTYVEQHKGPDDLVIDLDVILSQLTGLPLHRNFGSPRLNEGLEIRNAMLRSLATDSTHPAAWFIVTAPDPDERALWAKRLGGKLVTLLVPLVECERRIRNDSTRSGGGERMIAAARKWWSINNRGVRPTIGVDGWPVTG